MQQLAIPRLDSRAENSEKFLENLISRLSPAGNVVSEAGRKRTIELFGEPLSPQQVVERICADVRSEGLSALLDYTARLDGKELTSETLRLADAEFQTAHENVSAEYLAAIRKARDNIVEFQSAILNQDVVVQRKVGAGNVELRQRHLPLRRVGVCVPGGAAAYPSTLLMTAVPAQVAGVKEIAVVVPPTEFGGYNPHLLAACRELGVTEVYRAGGAQAVAALAYGVEGMPRVDKIVGPGNLFVALAKRLVFGEVDIDSIAGPSEVIVIADATAEPRFVAADLIAQAEHSPGSGVLLTWHEPLIAEVKAELERQLESLARGDLARACLEEFGALILVENEDAACRLSDRFAPEHLHLITDDPERTLSKTHSAGAIFLGNHSPVAIGDYIAGPSHVLPTGGTARFANGLCSNDFLKRSSVICYDRDALAADATDLETIANVEGLTAHAASVTGRVE